MAAMKTPGVYIVEKSAFPNSVVEVATAVPAFIGYTERALNRTEVLKNKPFRISSMGEYHTFFGGAPTPTFTVSVSKDIANTPPPEKKTLKIVTPAGNIFDIIVDNEHTLYYNLKLFFANGGGPCYIVSIGNYNTKMKSDDFKNALEPLKKEMEPTMIVIPEAVSLIETDCIGIQQEMLNHCGYVMQNRFAILDVYMNKYQNDPTKYVANFRTAIGTNFLNYGAAYYPWLETTVLSDADISLDNITWNKAEIAKLLLGVSGKGEALAKYFKEKTRANTSSYTPTDKEALILKEYQKQVKQELYKDLFSAATNASIENGTITMTVPNEDAKTKITPGLGKLTTAVQDSCAKNVAIGDEDAKKVKIGVKVMVNEKELAQNKIDLHSALIQNWPCYQLIVKAIKENINLLPPSAAMAGLYTMVDNTRGVWKAPANISVNNTNKPNLNITNADQEDLNVPLNGKAVNAIRTFIGEGVKVWGARTLDGNSLDWRYINVRRTMIFLEESVKNAARAYVFEPNVSDTWLNMKCMIDNFLRGVWKRGGLAGTTPEDAYSVHVGLGNTMTAEDILEGIMRITVLVAISRPAEFIEITFQQQMQKS